ncbi:MAG: hypothetical protein JXA03_13975 [Bacteroidales bacterium]|nr:hypothetical protein [Bacteroidales bacterium]
MNDEVNIVKINLRQAFVSASDIYVDIMNKVCEVTVSVDDFQGESIGYIVTDSITFTMIDYVDNYPFKYVFSYRLKPLGYLA